MLGTCKCNIHRIKNSIIATTAAQFTFPRFETVTTLTISAKKVHDIPRQRLHQTAKPG